MVEVLAVWVFLSTTYCLTSLCISGPGHVLTKLWLIQRQMHLLWCKTRWSDLGAEASAVLQHWNAFHDVNLCGCCCGALLAGPSHSRFPCGVSGDAAWHFLQPSLHVAVFSFCHTESWGKCDDVKIIRLNPDKPLAAQGVLDYRYFQKLAHFKELVKHRHITQITAMML